MAEIKPVAWVGSSKVDLSVFPEEVKDSMGFALYVAQQGGKHRDAKPLRGFAGAGVLEIVDDFDGDTYRAVYTVRLPGPRIRFARFPEKIKAWDQTTDR